MPYALTIAGCSLVGYILIGVTGNGLLGLIISAVLLVVVVYGMHRMAVSRTAAEA